MPADYFQPTGLDEAIALLRTGEATLIAGGTDVFPATGQTPIATNLIDLTRVNGLRGITCVGETMRIGAATTWSEIIAADLPRAFAGLQAASSQVGGVQIQNAGTVAGNLCNASPAADGVPPLLTLDALVEIVGPDGTRTLPLSGFITGPRKTALSSWEILAAILVPRPPAHTVGAFEKLGSRAYLVISIAMTAVLLGLDARGTIDFARVAVGACSTVAQRLPALEQSLIGQTPDAILVDPSHVASLCPISDVRADRAYRLEAVREQIVRAIRKAAGVASDG